MIGLEFENVLIEIGPGEHARDMLTLTRLGLPYDLRKSLVSTNIMGSVNSVIARASRNVTRWRSASMGLRWTAAGMLMASSAFAASTATSTVPSWPTRSTGSTRRGRAASPGGWPPAHRETRGPRSLIGPFQKVQQALGQRPAPAKPARCVPESAGSPLQGCWNPGMPSAERESLTSLEGAGYTRAEAVSVSRSQRRLGHFPSECWQALRHECSDGLDIPAVAATARLFGRRVVRRSWGEPGEQISDMSIH